MTLSSEAPTVFRALKEKTIPNKCWTLYLHRLIHKRRRTFPFPSQNIRLGNTPFYYITGTKSSVKARILNNARISIDAKQLESTWNFLQEQHHFDTCDILFTDQMTVEELIFIFVDQSHSGLLVCRPSGWGIRPEPFFGTIKDMWAVFPRDKSWPSFEAAARVDFWDFWAQFKRRATRYYYPVHRLSLAKLVLPNISAAKWDIIEKEFLSLLETERHFPPGVGAIINSFICMSSAQMVEVIHYHVIWVGIMSSNAKYQNKHQTPQSPIN